MLSGPMTLPPTVLHFDHVGADAGVEESRAYCLPVRPRVTTRMMEAEPMTMPSMVRRKRTFDARKAVDREAGDLGKDHGGAGGGEGRVKGGRLANGSGEGGHLFSEARLLNQYRSTCVLKLIGFGCHVARPRCGGMCEWLKQAVLKTALPLRVTGVRIPLPPPNSL